VVGVNNVGGCFGLDRPEKRESKTGKPRLAFPSSRSRTGSTLRSGSPTGSASIRLPP